MVMTQGVAPWERVCLPLNSEILNIEKCVCVCVYMQASKRKEGGRERERQRDFKFSEAGKLQTRWGLKLGGNGKVTLELDLNKTGK